MALSQKLQLAFTAAAAVIIPGVADYALAAMGYETLATLVWVSGYGFGVIVIWYVWVRPLDITAPDGIQTSEGEETTNEAGDSSA